MRPHTTIYVSSYYYICVLILLQVEIIAPVVRAEAPDGAPYAKVLKTLD
jgi:hypothetical protein